MIPRTGAPTARRASHGFTLVELIATLTVLAALAVVAVSSVSAVGRVGARAFSFEVERALRGARTAAMATGLSAGVSVNTATATVSYVALDAAGVVTPRLGPTGEPIPDLRGQLLHPDAGFASVVHGNGTIGIGTIWFDADGAPFWRSKTGVITPYTQNATITCNDSTTITVWMTTGAVTR